MLTTQQNYWDPAHPWSQEVMWFIFIWCLPSSQEIRQVPKGSLSGGKWCAFSSSSFISGSCLWFPWSHPTGWESNFLLLADFSSGKWRLYMFHSHLLIRVDWQGFTLGDFVIQMHLGWFSVFLSYRVFIKRSDSYPELGENWQVRKYNFRECWPFAPSHIVEINPY